jgi:pyruvate/2-oxoglutarate/acetoin dehydrogenase E1 component
VHRVSYLQAINEALIEEMERDERVFLMGEDVGWNLMGATGGLAEKFGKERVRNTPISEAGFVGAAAGAAMVGMRPVVDMLIAPFVYVAFDQFVSIIAKSTYLYGGQAKMPVTVRGADALWVRERGPAFRPAVRHLHVHTRPEADRPGYALRRQGHAQGRHP